MGSAAERRSGAFGLILCCGELHDDTLYVCHLPAPWILLTYICRLQLG